MEFVAIWSHVLDETTSSVVHYFRQLNQYLRVDYTEIPMQVNPKLSVRSKIE